MWQSAAPSGPEHWGVKVEGLEAIEFELPDGPAYDGFTDGSTWNGWANVCVTPLIRSAIVTMLAAVGDTDAAADVGTLPTDARGLIPLNGYCTVIVDSHEYHGGAAGSFAAEGCQRCIEIEKSARAWKG